MKVFIVNNGTKHIGTLTKQLLELGHEVKVVNFNQLDHKDSQIKDQDCIILTGGGFFSVQNHSHKYDQVMKLIRNTKKPTLGICMGYQLIIKAYGGEMKKLNERNWTIANLKVKQESPLFDNLGKSFKVYKSHLWKPKRIEVLENLAKDGKDSSIIKHPKKPIYGVDFHPEAYTSETDGFKILKNFLEMAEKN